MATDATGIPTSPDNIPTYNTAVDSPSGNGFNAAMAQIQTALSSRVTIPAGLVSTEVPVWNGSAWVRSSTTQIGPASLGTGAPSILSFLRGDGAWAKGGMTLLYDSVDAGVTLPAASFTTPALDQSFKHLMIVWNSKSGAAGPDWLGLQFNGVATSNYNYQYLYGQTTSSAASGAITTLALVGQIAQANGYDSCGVAFIPRYADATSFKPGVALSFAETAAAPTFATTIIGFQLNNGNGAGISTIKFLTNSGSNVQTGRYTIYGI